MKKIKNNWLYSYIYVQYVHKYSYIINIKFLKISANINNDNNKYIFICNTVFFYLVSFNICENKYSNSLKKNSIVDWTTIFRKI